jgi:hypothetical protein
MEPLALGSFPWALVLSFPWSPVGLFPCGPCLGPSLRRLLGPSIGSCRALPLGACWALPWGPCYALPWGPWVVAPSLTHSSFIRSFTVTPGLELRWSGGGPVLVARPGEMACRVGGSYGRNGGGSGMCLAASGMWLMMLSWMKSGFVAGPTVLTCRRYKYSGFILFECSCFLDCCACTFWKYHKLSGSVVSNNQMLLDLVRHLPCGPSWSLPLGPCCALPWGPYRAFPWALVEHCNCLPMFSVHVVSKQYIHALQL